MGHPLFIVAFLAKQNFPSVSQDRTPAFREVGPIRKKKTNAPSEETHAVFTCWIQASPTNLQRFLSSDRKNQEQSTRTIPVIYSRLRRIPHKNILTNSTKSPHLALTRYHQLKPRGFVLSETRSHTLWKSFLSRSRWSARLIY